MGKGFGDIQKGRHRAEERRDYLKSFDEVIPWEIFRDFLEQLPSKERKSNAGRKPIDPLILFKLLILQRLYNFSDENLEYMTHDRMSFRRFVGLEPEAEVPDAKTIWLFRQKLTEAGLAEVMFQRFEELLQGAGYEARGGEIVEFSLTKIGKTEIED